MESRSCAACGRAVRPRSHGDGSCYCGSAECRRERRRLWQRRKRRDDPDYRCNQARAQRNWAERHPQYWRDYRLAHPDYDERNRVQQRERDRRRRGAVSAAEAAVSADLAKMASTAPIPPVSSGFYRILPAAGEDLAKMDSWMVKITFLSKGCGSAGEDRPILQREDSIGTVEPP